MSYSFSLQRALVTTQTDKDKVETELLKQQEKVNILETQVVKCQKDRENLEHEMEMLLDRIKKLSELLDKAKVGVFTGYILNDLTSPQQGGRRRESRNLCNNT